MEYFMMPRNAWYMADADGVGCEYDPNAATSSPCVHRGQRREYPRYKFFSASVRAAIARRQPDHDVAKGKSIRDALQITEEEIMDALGGLPEEKRHCSDLALVRCSRRYWTTSPNKAVVLKNIYRK
jgi:nitrogen fixation NifU-like protein